MYLKHYIICICLSSEFVPYLPDMADSASDLVTSIDSHTAVSSDWIQDLHWCDVMSNTG